MTTPDRDGRAGDLREAVERGLRKCRVEDGAPVPLIHERDLFHITHMVTVEVEALLAEHPATPAEEARLGAILQPPCGWCGRQWHEPPGAGCKNPHHTPRPAEVAGEEREALVDDARRITHDRMAHYGYTPEQILDAETTTHESAGCVYENGWVCESEQGTPNHAWRDALEDAAEFVMWVLEHPALRDRDAALTAKAKAEGAGEALREAADALNIEAVDFQVGWGSNPLDQAKLDVLGKTLNWLRERADRSER